MHNNKEAIKAAFLHLCSLDADHARTQNGIGWSGTHSRIAHEAKHGINTWSNGSFRYWAKALIRYSGQLKNAGFDMSELAWADSATKKIDRCGTGFAIKFEDISKAEFGEILAAVRALPQRSFDGAAKSWRAPNTPANQVALQALAQRFGFEISETAAELFASDSETVPRETISQPIENPNKLEKVGKIWRVSFAFDWAIVNAIKALPAGIYKKWQPSLADKPWDITPCTELLAIAQKFNFAGAELLQAELEATGQLGVVQPCVSKSAQTLSAEQLARFDSLKPKLLPYQTQAVKNLATALLAGGALDASDTGTGKTYIALAACAVLGRPAYVVCPKPVKTSWQRAAAHFGVDIRLCNYELLRRGKQTECQLRKTDDGKSEAFVWDLPKETIVIFDECHRLKDYKTLQCQLGINALEQGYTVLGLSATAADNPLQMKFAAMLTGQISTQKAFWPWALRHGIEKQRFGYAFNGSRSILKEIHHAIFPARGIRVRIADLGDAFPQTQISAECYDMNGESDAIRLVYDEMKAELDKLDARMASDKLGSQGEHFRIRLRARQRVELLKVPALVEMAQDAIESGLAVAIFVNFDETINALCEKLNTKCVIRGGQSDSVRQSNIDAFNADREPVIIANIRAGGVGVSLHGNPSSKTRLALISPCDSGQDLKQALGRVWRAEGAKSLQRIVFAADTIEEEVCANVRTKINRIETLNDGDLAIGKAF